jgi:hypothetical protein
VIQKFPYAIDVSQDIEAVKKAFFRRICSYTGGARYVEWEFNQDLARMWSKFLGKYNPDKAEGAKIQQEISQWDVNDTSHPAL